MSESIQVYTGRVKRGAGLERHLDPTVRSLPGKMVDVFPGFAEHFRDSQGRLLSTLVQIQAEGQDPMKIATFSLELSDEAIAAIMRQAGPIKPRRATI